MKQKRIFVLLICVVAVSLFFLSNHVFRGYLREEANAKDFRAHRVDSLDYYQITLKAPFKYRVLFSSIVSTSFEVVNGNHKDPVAYYHIYKFWSLVFFVTSAVAMFFLLKSVGFERQFSLLGALTFLLLPPMAFAFTTPVHTREDTLAYSLFFIGLILLIKQKPSPFLLISLLGVLTRETLLLLPLLYFFYSGDDNLVRRFLIAGLPGVLFLLIRFSLGVDKYDMWEGLRWNLNNPEQVVAFLALTFSFAWLPFLLHLVYYKSSVSGTVERPVHFFYKTSVVTLFIVLLTTFFGGIYNEIRLLYLFAPWVIVIFVDFVQTNWIFVKTLINNNNFKIFVAVVTVCCLGLLIFISRSWETIITPGKFKVAYELWLNVFVVYLTFTVLCVPFALKFLSLKKAFK